MMTSGQRTRLQFEWMPALRSKQPALGSLLGDARGDRRRRLLRRAILDVLDSEHRAEAAHVADRGEPLLPREHPRADRLADALRALDEPLLLEHVEDGDCGRERDGIADVRAADRVVPEGVHDLGLAEHAGERQAAGDRLGERA